MKRLIVGSLILVLMVLLIGCFGPFKEEVSNKGEIKGVVTFEGVGVSGVKVEILNSGISAKYTNSSGAYKFTDIPEGSYTLHFAKNDGGLVIDKDKTIVVSGGKTATVNLLLGNLSVEGTKLFISELKEHGVNLVDAGNEQAMNIMNNFNDDVGPYMEAVGVRFGMIAQTIDFWAENLLFADDGTPTPGDYVLDVVSEDQPRIDNYQPLDLEEDPWVWNITTTTNEEVTITLTNLNTIIDMANEVIDLTEANFHYTFDHDGDGTVEWEFDYDLSCSEFELLVDGIDMDGQLMDIKAPNVAEGEYGIELTGTLTDNLHGSGAQFEELPAIGTVELNGSLQFDLVTDNYLSYTGTFNSEEVYFNGNTYIEFYSFPSYANILAETDVPEVKRIDTDSIFQTDVVELTGGANIEFSQGIIYPDLVYFEGSYQNIAEDTDGFAFTGSVEINPDYSDYDFNSEEGENNYLPVVITLTGGLTNTDFEDVDLVITVSRDGYQYVTSTFRYDFAGSKFIEGELDVDIANEEVLLQAFNQDDLKLVIDPGGYSIQNKVGEITNPDGTKLFANIIDDGEQLIIVYKDQETQSLIP